MDALSKELYDTMGVWVFILSCYLKLEGDLDISMYDFNQELGNGKDYLDIHGQSFQEEGILVSSWRAHNEEYYGSEDLTGAEGGYQGSQAAMILEKNQYGEPDIPDPLKPPVDLSSGSSPFLLYSSAVDCSCSNCLFLSFPIISVTTRSRKSKWVGSPPLGLFSPAFIALAQSLFASVSMASLYSCWNTCRGCHCFPIFGIFWVLLRPNWPNQALIS